MYVSQNKSHLKIGYNGLGAAAPAAPGIPQTTITLTLGSTKITLTGPAHETPQASTVVSLLASAVSAAKKGQGMEAQAVLANAKGMLPSTGSLRPKVEPFIAAAESEINAAAPASNTFSKKGINPMFIAAGVGGLLIVGLLFLRK